MKKLIPKEERVKELLKFGVPKKFIENIENTEEIEYCVENTDGAYFYLPTISGYEILRNLNIIPIYDSGEIFYVFAYNQTTKKIIEFGLETDEIWTDYKENWQLLILDILFNHFDLYDEGEITKEEFIEVGNKIGFEKTTELFTLMNITDEEREERLKGNVLLEIKNWQNEIAEKLKIL